MATTTPAGVRGGHAKHGGSSDTPSGTPMTHRQIMEALAGLMLGMFVAILSSTVVSNALPEIISDLGGGQSAYTWVVTASLLAMTATTPLWGKLSDLFSKKLLVQIALLIYVAGSVVAGLSTSSGMLIACRVVQGIGVGGLSALAQIVMAAMIAPRERGRYSGYIGAVFAVATVGGPLLGGVITDTSWMGWRWCFYVGVPFAVIALIVLQKTLKLPVVKREVKVDWTGAFFISAAVSLLLLWVTFAGDKYDWLSWQSGVMLLGSAALALLFIVVESKASEPIIPLRLFRNRTITLASLASLFVGIAMFAGTVFFSQYFQLARGKSPTMSGVMTIPMIAGLFVSSTVSGQIITKTGRWKAWLVSGGFLVTAGLGLLGTIRYDTTYWHIAVFMAVMGLGIGMMMQNLVLATQNQVAPSDLGSASSVVTFFRSLGGAIGVSALGAVMANRVTHYVKDGLAELGPKGEAMGHGGTGGGGIPDVHALPEPFRTVVESAYGHGVGDVFLYAAPAALIAFLITIFIKEVALKTTAVSDAPATAEAPVAEAVEALATVPSSPVVSPAASVTTLEAPVATLQGTAVHGVVRGAEGAPVARAAVTLISLAGRQLGRSVAQADGSYGLDAPGSGSYVLIASADGFQPQASTVVVGDEPLSYDILLSGTSGLAGIVRTAETAAPVEGAMVIVTDVRGDVLAAGKSGGTGEFAFGELVPGSVTVAVNAAGFRPLALPVEIGGQGVTRIEAALQSGALVQGVVRAGSGRRPLPDARVTLVDAAGNVVATSTTGEDGAYAFTDLDAGEYSVVATGYPPVAGALTVAGRGVDGHDIELAHPGE
ncbi:MULTISPECIES: MFS transporter [unclassified Streptomyces]|uniref:MFS transporter n=1 Tax=unclassified Streptomyces TaxID=2593676 RepID=UPI00224D14D2|nr:MULTISPECIES: DHA2 family efflux MFS transporter permease subunit [unclassified Streptomyces]WSP56346.1 DHA2 family efflux MFS transporter permease subunit [Streptomyces sp. NBC_01241]WSU22937.1 DHA2 family efflux MFS transporter permease subunit [Streptomyces sp. NBC_01108]MCX4788071.1 DHA2 family efflux MFS transporter permease subunit [Streptomyces sp. NBC_01221]MCX4796168.1 DHA2 family efflux MFS transporter permease subunit [Streptomyces sp. NBC_01242]WSJ37422.1 DHA2 family efflux MFS 